MQPARPPADSPAVQRSPRSPVALYPALLAAMLVIELINVSGVSAFSAGRPMIIAIVGGVFLSIIGTILMRDRHRGGVLAAIWVLALMAGDDPRLALVIALATVLLFVERFVLPRERRTIRWSRIGTYFSRLVAVLALVIVIQAIQTGAVEGLLRAAVHETPLRPAVAAASPASSDPDIYLILLDGHARSDVLSQVFDHDDSAFLDALEADGFDVASRSRSNYTQTGETLSSMFSQAQLRDIPRMAGLLAVTESRPAGGIVREVVNDNATWGFLRQRGYEIDAVSSGFEQVSVREADRFVDTGQLNEFEIAMIKRSIGGYLLDALAGDAVSAQQRERIRGVFASIASAPGWIGAGPQFVFAHVPSPHAPWVFRSDGSPRTVSFRDEWMAETPASTGLTVDELKRSYSEQVVDADRRMLEALAGLDAGIADRGRPAIVILFSDHGSWIGADGGDIRLRFKNLLAIRSSGADVTLEPNLTLVNLLPSLFDQVYGTGWTRRPDTQYRFGPRDAFELISVDDPDAVASP